MTRHAGLAARVARIERARAPRTLPRLAFTIFDQDAAITGFSGPSGVVCERRVGEDLQALVSRSAAILGETAIWATFAPELEPEAVPEPPPTVGTPTDVDPFARAGIGRAATVAELTRMGVTPTPAERLS